IRQADHRCFSDAGAQRQATLDLDRRYVLAAGDNHVIDTSRDEQVAVGVDITAVAREVPPSLQRLGISIRALPVALECFITCKIGYYFAFLPGFCLQSRVCLAQLHNADALIDTRPPRRARLCRRMLTDCKGVDLGRAVMVHEKLWSKCGLEGA